MIEQVRDKVSSIREGYLQREPVQGSKKHSKGHIHEERGYLYPRRLWIRVKFENSLCPWGAQAAQYNAL